MDYYTLEDRTVVFEIFNGVKYVKDEKRGYYHAHVGGTTKLLHRAVWEYYNGAIPNGYHIHHIDGNKDNNNINNLDMILASEHLSMHAKDNFEQNSEFFISHLEKIRPLASEWHGSEEGKAWHSDHAKNIAKNMEKVEKECEYCGSAYLVKKAFAYKSRFCSNKCKAAYRRKSGADNILCKCIICGREFTKNKYESAMTCSRECSYIYGHRNKKNNKT